MILTGSLVLILLTEILGQDDEVLFSTEQYTSSPPPVPAVEDQPGPILIGVPFAENDSDDAGLPGLIGTPDRLPENNHNNHVILEPIDIHDYYPEMESDDMIRGGIWTPEVGHHTEKKICGFKGLFDGPEFDAIYRLKMTDPPAYLKEYYDSFKDVQDPCEKHCNDFDVMKALRLYQHKKFTVSRPVENHLTLTYIYLDMSIAAILNVKENDQLFITHIWVYMSWHNKLIFWDPDKFCGIKHIVVPSDTLWKPDIIIEEMVEKDKTPPSPFLKISSFGEVEHRVDQVVMGACRMDVYKFPFDVQHCNISFKSLLYSDEEIRFVVNKNTTVLSKWADYAMQSQHEWIFVKMTVNSKMTNYYFGSNQTVIVYTVFMQRRAILHAANFLLPIFFFLCMDLASFLIPDSGGEKISFRITVLLAVTVLQLILHDILPCSSKKLPLIVVYCIGIFLLMLLSLLEAILARYLVQKDSEIQDYQTRAAQSRKSETRGSFFISSKESKDSRRPSSLSHTLPDKSPSDTKETTNGKPSEVSLDFTTTAEEQEKVSSVLRMGEEEPGYWTRRARDINRGFFMLYLIAATVFLIYMVSLWIRPDDDDQ